MKIAIVGAGISGLATAFFLKKNRPDLHIEIFEKDNQVGGRLATQKISGSKVVDTGCQYLSIEDEEILDFLFDTLPKENVRPLPGPILCLPEAWVIDTDHRFVLSQGMQSWSDAIVQRIEGVKIHLGRKVQKLSDLWDKGFDKILVSGAGADAKALGSAQAGEYWPCLSLFFFWHNPPVETLEYFAYRDLVFRNGCIWLAHEGLKHQEPGIWTAQLSPEATDIWKQLSFEDLEDKLQEDLASWLPIFARGEKTLIDTKYWPQAFPAMAPDISEQAAFEKRRGPKDGQELYFLGDGYLGVGRVENALQSALATAKGILADPVPELK